MGVTWILGVSKREIRDNGDIRRSEAERQRACLDEEIKEEDSKVSAGRESSLHCTVGQEISLLSPWAVTPLSDWWDRHLTHKA